MTTIERPADAPAGPAPGSPALGRPLVRQDGPAKVTGAARYAYEHPVHDPAYAWPVVSTIAKGRVLAVDAGAALALDGVLDVLSGDNAAPLRADVEVPPPHLTSLPELMLLQSPDVAYRGQVVAAVVATSLEAARQGAGLVEVSYEEQPHDVVLREDDERAYAPDATNDGTPGEVARGDADAAFAAAPVQVDATYRTPAEQAVPMEPHSATAVWEGQHLTVYHSDQAPFWSSVTLGAMLGLEPGAVEVVADHVGGGFGSKAGPRPPVMLAVLASRLVGRPVKVALNRPQSFSLTTYRTPTVQRVRLGADADGRLSAVVHEALHQSSTLVEYTEQTVSPTRMMYDVADVRTSAHLVRLDVATPGWYRAPGETPGMYALESAMDELAVAVGVDPVELRIRNEPSVDPETGEDFSSRNLVACLRQGAELFGWAPRDPTPAARREGRWLVGTGVAAATYPFVLFPATATATAEPSGAFTVGVAAVDIGTGARTVLHQVAADALGVPMERVSLQIGRASLGMAPFAGGSMGTASWGLAIERACQAVLARVAEHDGAVPAAGLRATADTTEEATAPSGLSRHSSGAQFAQVGVDVDTGQVRVDRMLGVFAAGRILNPRTARSQLRGAMVQGLGMALLEGAEPDLEFGDFANHDLVTYHVPAHADVRDVQAHWLEEVDPHLTPMGGKGVGEVGIVGAAAAVANAVFHATGLRVRDLPIRIEDVRPALAGLRATAAAGAS